MSRGVLQELVRHRIASYSVKSTRYTMSSLINAFCIDTYFNYNNTVPTKWFITKVHELDLFVTSEKKYNKIQIIDIWKKLKYQFNKKTKEEFYKIAISKSSIEYLQSTEPCNIKFKLMQDGKSKRNVGDAFKHIVNDNWKVDLVITINLRSLKNFFQLRDSGAAYFQIKWLAQTIKAVTPQKYLNLIVKSKI